MKPKYFKLWIADYSAYTSHLTDAQFGKLMRILLRRSMGFPPEKIPENLKNSYEIFVELQNNDFEKYNKRIEINQEIAETKRNPEGIQKDIHMDSQPEPKPEPDILGKPNIDYKPHLSAYNEMALRAGLPKAQRLTDTRKSKLKARLAECGGLDGWTAAMEMVASSPFLTGDNNRGWKASLDFILQESSFTKLMEGAYNGTNKPQTRTDRIKDGIQEWVDG